MPVAAGIVYRIWERQRAGTVKRQWSVAGGQERQWPVASSQWPVAAVASSRRPGPGAGGQWPGAGGRQEQRGPVGGCRTRDGMATCTHGRIVHGGDGDRLESRAGWYCLPVADPKLSNSRARVLEERCQGGVAGGVPPHKGGPERPDRPRELREAYSAPLPKDGAWTGRGCVDNRGKGIYSSIGDFVDSRAAEAWHCV